MNAWLALPHSGWRTLLELTRWFRGTHSSTLERERAPVAEPQMQTPRQVVAAPLLVLLFSLPVSRPHLVSGFLFRGMVSTVSTGKRGSTFDLRRASRLSSRWAALFEG